MSGDGLSIYREKLAHLERELAVCADAAQKSAIQKAIEEVKAKIAELERLTTSRSSTGVGGGSTAPPRAHESINDDRQPASQVSRSRPFDVFVSHNSKDKPMVRQLGTALKDRGLRVWLDEWELVPGRPWQEAVEEIIRTTNSAAVVVGSDGLGPWEEPEMRACLDQFVRRRLPVIPVLLPDAPSKPVLPLFLQNFVWVDLRGGMTDEGLDRMEWGITGIRPGTPRTGSGTSTGSSRTPADKKRESGAKISLSNSKVGRLQLPGSGRGPKSRVLGDCRLD